MATSEDVVQLPLDGTGKKLRAQTGGTMPAGTYAEVLVLQDTLGGLVDPADKASVTNITTTIGSDGAGAPANPGTGLRGWARGAFEKLTAIATALVDGSQIVGMPGVVVASNSTTAVLGAGGSFTASAWIDTLPYGALDVAVFADVASATDGLVVEYSSDGVTARDSDVYTVPAANGQSIKVGSGWRYARVRYTNGAAAQATFIVQTIARSLMQKSSTHRAADTVDGQQDTDLVTSLVKLQRPDGTYAGAKAMQSGVAIVDKPAITLGSPTVVSATGNQVVYTPTAGKTPILKWIYITAADDSAPNSLVVKWRNAANSTDLGTLYNIDLTSPGVFGKTTNRQAPAPDAILVVSQSAGRTIRVNLDIEEV